MAETLLLNQPFMNVGLQYGKFQIDAPPRITDPNELAGTFRRCSVLRSSEGSLTTTNSSSLIGLSSVHKK